MNLDGAAQFHQAVWAELSDNADALIQALDQAGEWLETPLTVGAVGSDNRRYAQVGFPTVGLALGGVGGHTPADTVAARDSRLVSERAMSYPIVDVIVAVRAADTSGKCDTG